MPGAKPKRGWLCMNPEKFTAWGMDVDMPDDVLAVLCAYRTKRAARAVHGKNAVLHEITFPKEKPDAQAQA